MSLLPRGVTCLFFAGLGFSAADVRAESPDEPIRVLPCRPTISCSADIVPPGALEVELGYSTRRVRLGGFVSTQPALVKLTALPWLQFQLGTNGYIFSSGAVPRELRYIDDVSVGLKTHFVDQTTATPSIAVSATWSIPSPYRDSAFPFAYDASFWAYVSKDQGRLHVDLNGGVNFWQFELKERSYQPFVALAATVALPLSLGAMAESYWFDDGGRIAPRDAGFLIAASYAPSPSLLFDAGGDMSFFPSTRTYSIFAGVTFVASRLWGPPARSERSALHGTAPASPAVPASFRSPRPVPSATRVVTGPS
jgi:hypothetical protein